MKKTKNIRAKQILNRQTQLKPEETLQFLEDFSSLIHGKDSATQLISLRVPKNILNAFKSRAKIQNLKYQSEIVKLMREWLKS